MSKLARALSSSDCDFKGLVGYADVLESLRSSGRKTTFPSLIFSGPAGVGKRLTGLWYAAFLNCFAPDEKAPCGVCTACQKIASGNHPDVSIASVPSDKTVLGVGEVREAISSLGYAPFEGSFRVLIIEKAEKLTDEAQNALLKTLEEPPSRAIIILATSLFGSLIPTVVSRCRVMRFALLSEELVQKKMLAMGADEGQAQRLAKLCRGSIGTAISLHQEPKELERRQQAVSLYLGLTDSSLYRASLAAGQMEKLFAGRLEELLKLGQDAYRDLLMLACGCLDLVVFEGQVDKMKEVVSRRSVQDIRRCLDLFAQADLQRVLNVNPKMLLQRLCVSLARGKEA